jgi:Na+-translocating ferredoxin:NAD+ oxidoreductase subunit D
MAAPLLLQTSPFVKSPTSTQRVMIDVAIGLAPVTAAAIWYFGLNALLILLVTTASAVAAEWLLSAKKSSIFDASAAVTGLVLGLTLPPTLPLWMAVVGSFAAIGLGKLVWGGLGQNLFNPALVGRAFLQAAFPSALTTWTAPREQLTEVSGRLLATPMMQPKVDIVTAASPLAKMKFDHIDTPLSALMSGEVAGSLGETSFLLILLGGFYMLVRRTFDWRIPAGILLSVAVLSGILHLVNPTLPTPWFMLGAGGLMFGAIYMATDPVTSPTTPRGAWLFAAGIGVLVVLIRLWGGLPEGVMYAILLMNAATPLIERITQPLPFGRERKAKS